MHVTLLLFIETCIAFTSDWSRKLKAVQQQHQTAAERVQALEHQLGLLHSAAQVGDWLGMVILLHSAAQVGDFVSTCHYDFCICVGHSGIRHCGVGRTRRNKAPGKVCHYRSQTTGGESRIPGKRGIWSVCFVGLFVCLREIIIPH